MLLSPFCIFSDPGAGLFSLERCVCGGVCLGQAPGQEGSYPTPEFFCPPFRALCGGMKERVKSSMHMAPLFTMIKEGGHYLSLGSLLNTLWCH